MKEHLADDSSYTFAQQNMTSMKSMIEEGEEVLSFDEL